jgi:hypothetical protein
MPPKSLFKDKRYIQILDDIVEDYKKQQIEMAIMNGTIERGDKEGRRQIRDNVGKMLNEMIVGKSGIKKPNPIMEGLQDDAEQVYNSQSKKMKERVKAKKERAQQRYEVGRAEARMEDEEYRAENPNMPVIAVKPQRSVFNRLFQGALKAGRGVISAMRNKQKGEFSDMSGV